MADVADIVSAGTQCAKKFNRSHDRDVRPHGDCDRQRKEPYFSIGKQDGVRDQDSKNGARRANRGNYRRLLPKENWNRLYQHVYQSRADPTKEKILEKSPFAPDQLQVAPEHPENEHVDKQVPQTTVEEHVGERLPKAHPVRDREWDQAENLCDVVVALLRPGKKVNERLDEENPGAYKNKDLDSGRDKAAPVEVISPRSVCPAHICSLRPRAHAVKD